MRHDWIFLFLTCMLVTPSGFASEHTPPNVLMIIADDLSATALACYGNTQCQTPHIDALAARGTRFERAFCQYPICGPSRAVIMSGMYPQAIGSLGNGDSDRFTENLGSRPSFAEWFRRHDYFTARMGKIFHMRVPGDITAGVDGPDHLKSWVERYNCRGPEWMSEGTHHQLSNEPLNRDPNRHYGLGFGASFYVVKSDGDGHEQPDVQAADRAIALMKQQRDQPFFLAVGFVRPHVPLVAPREYFEPYPPATMQLPPNQPNDLNDIPPLGRKGSAIDRGLDSTFRQQQALAAYYASVTFMDAQVGRVIAELDRLNKTSNTIVIFLSDHGYHLGEHQLWQKQSLHEESARIPMVIAGPNIPASVRQSLVEQIDLFPTVSELAGLTAPEHCQGRSLTDVIRSGDTTVRDAAYCTRGRDDHLLRTDRWAFIRYRDRQKELYDMRNDPYQFTNLASDPRYHATLAQLDAQLDTRISELETN